MAERTGSRTVTRVVAPGEAGGPLRACLKVVAGKDRGRLLFLAEGATLLGRGGDCGLRFTDAALSRQHAKLVVDPRGTVQLVDLGSRNGTLVDGRRVDAAVLHEGALVQAGELVLRFGYAADPARPDEQSVLSARELEVALLVAEGLSNADVAKRLHISPRTVSAHLTHIYDRLGLRTRAKLTRWLHDQRLLAEP